MMRLDAAWTLPIGPGRLVAVAGPSGAGKDTLLRFARNHLGGDPNIVFPHRVVTRQPSAAEDHHAFSEADFAAAVAAGGFAFWWYAHGLNYAVGAAVDDDIRAGKTVVCNVSRAVIAELRCRYADVRVVLVTAPAVLILTTDIPSPIAEFDGKYSRGTGTSFAAPIVSGVAALMLDANPNLGWRDVQNIIAASARMRE